MGALLISGPCAPLGLPSMVPAEEGAMSVAGEPNMILILVLVVVLVVVVIMLMLIALRLNNDNW